MGSRWFSYRSSRTSLWEIFFVFLFQLLYRCMTRHHSSINLKVFLNVSEDLFRGLQAIWMHDNPKHQEGGAALILEVVTCVSNIVTRRNGTYDKMFLSFRQFLSYCLEHIIYVFVF